MCFVETSDSKTMTSQEQIVAIIYPDKDEVPTFKRNLDIKEFEARYTDFMKRFDSDSLEFGYTVEKDSLRHEILLFETAELLRKEATNKDSTFQYAITRILLEYVTPFKLKELHAEYSQLKGENEGLYYIEQEIDRINPNVYTDERQFDFDNILSLPPFVKNN